MQAAEEEPVGDRIFDDLYAVAARKIHSRQIQVVDLTHFFCGRRVCYSVVGGVQESPQARRRARHAELPLHDLPTQRRRGLDQHQAGRDPADRPRKERGGRVASGLVDHPLDGHGRVNDGEARRLNPTHPGPCV